MLKDYMAEGTVTGTGAAIAVALGFQPRSVDLFNTTGKAILHWTNTMGAGKGYKILTGIDATADTVSLHSLISSGGITVESGDQDTKQGFIIGTDTDINVNAEVIYYRAFR